jgi:hypothetical protein
MCQKNPNRFLLSGNDFTTCRGQKWIGSALGDLEFMDGVFLQEEISKKEKWFLNTEGNR